jgi:hypothetical protein
MGLAMARNLIKAGYEVHVWNRDASKCKELVSEGAKASTQLSGAVNTPFLIDQRPFVSRCQAVQHHLLAASLGKVQPLRLPPCLIHPPCSVCSLPAQQLASSPQELARSCTYTFAMLADPEAALAVATGSNGIAKGKSLHRSAKMCGRLLFYCCCVGRWHHECHQL